MNGHLLDDVLNLKLLFGLQLSEDINFLENLHDTFPLLDIFLTYDSVERLPVQLKTSGLGLGPDIRRPPRVIKHRYFTEHFPLHDSFDINLLFLGPSIAMQLSLVHNVYLVSFIPLLNYDYVFLVCLLSHHWDQLGSVFVVEVFK